MIIKPDGNPKIVYLDGVETKDVCLINTQRKYAEAFVRDENGKLVMDGMDFETQIIPFKTYKLEDRNATDLS